MNILHSILYIFFRPGVPGPTIPRLLVLFCFVLFCFFLFLVFFFQSDRPTQYQETHSTVSEGKNGDGLSSFKKWTTEHKDFG